MTTRHRLAIQVDGNIAIVRGWKASGTLRCAGLRPTFSGAAGGWMVDTARLSELLAWLDDRRFAYAIEGDQPARQRDVTPSRPEPEPEALLW